MRNKVLRRIVVIMAIAMFLITAAIVGSFVIVSLNDTETEVKEFADPVVDQISRFDSITKRDKFLADKRGGAINITIFNSNGDAVGDTAVKELNTPRYMTIAGIMNAYEKPITVWDHKAVKLDPADCGLNASPTQVFRSFTPPPKGKGEMLSGTAGKMAATLVDRLKEKHAI